MAGLAADLVISDGFQQTPVEVRWTVRWIHRKWQGPTKVCRNPLEKQWECKVLDLPLGLKVGPVAKLLMLFALFGFSAFVVFRLVVFASRADMWVWVSFIVVPMLLTCLATADALYVASSRICSIFSSLLATFSVSIVTELLTSWMAHMISAC